MSSFYDDLLNYPAQVEGIESYLSKLRTKTDMILSEANNVTMNGNSTALLDALKDIPGGRCPVGIALLLSFQADTLNGSSFPMFLFVCKTFFTYVPKSHVGLASKEVSKVLQRIVSVAFGIRKPRAGVNILQLAVRVLSPNPHCLTSAHALLLQACIKGQVYDVAVDFLRTHDILEIDMKNAPVSGSDFLKYFYYAGICYIAVNDYPSALASFFQCVSTPANALSHIVVSAVKKARLVALIHYGRELFISAPMSGVVSRFVKQPLPAYDPIGKAFAQDDRRALSAAIELGAEQLLKDGNLGLAQRALSALTSHRLRRLGTTFISLSLQDIAARVELDSPEQAEKELLSLVRKGELAAWVDPATGFVLFRDDTGLCATSDRAAHASTSSATPSSSAAGAGTGTGTLGSAQSAAQLQAYLAETMQLSARLQDMHRAALLSTKYIVKHTASRHLGMNIADLRGGMGGMGGIAGMGMGMDYHQMDLS